MKKSRISVTDLLKISWAYSQKDSQKYAEWRVSKSNFGKTAAGGLASLLESTT